MVLRDDVGQLALASFDASVPLDRTVAVIETTYLTAGHCYFVVLLA
jgi:hypothetical protein